MLLFFALGTAPTLLMVGVAASWTKKNRKTGIFKKAFGMLILVFAVYTFSFGLAIKDATGNIFFSRTTNQGEENLNLEKRQDSRGTNEQVVQMSITARGFQPSALRIKKNVPVRWVIRGDKVSGCTNKIIVPSLDIEKPMS